jgi:two-component system chemotaxis sensor kinase CheA
LTPDFNRAALLESFRQEAEECLVQLEQGLLQLEEDPRRNDLLQIIFRAVHTLKGNGALLEFEFIERLCHKIEDSLDHIRKGESALSQKLIALLLRCVDALRGSVALYLRGENGATEAGGQLLAELDRAETEEQEGPATTTPGIALPHASSASVESRERTLRINLETLDRMLDLTGEIAIAQGSLQRMLHELEAKGSNPLEVHGEIGRLFAQLQELVMKVRMVPVQPLFQQFYRHVHDLAQKHGKMARLVIEGGDVEIDTTVVEHLRDPILHMIRNAIDHGLETCEQRIAQGKPGFGTITLRASHELGSILIEIADDGAGFNRERILEKASALGISASSRNLSDEEIHNLVFESGLSTAKQVTDLSGRGIGMDVVKRNVERLRGSITIKSQPGHGTAITLRLPLTLAIINGFAVRAGEEEFILPLDSVVECLELPAEHNVGNPGGVINLRGKAVPYIRLRELFAVPGQHPEHENVVIVEHAGFRAGLAADVLLGEQQTVIKPLGSLFRHTQGIFGSTIMGDGRVALILDVPSLCRRLAVRQKTGLAIFDSQTSKYFPPGLSQGEERV